MLPIGDHHDSQRLPSRYPATHQQLRELRTLARRHNVERIHVFQHAESIDAGNAGVPEPQVLERWLPLDENAEGFKLQRCVPGARVKVGQLVSLRPRGAQHFILAAVRWALQEPDRATVIGARALPGDRSRMRSTSAQRGPLFPPAVLAGILAAQRGEPAGIPRLAVGLVAT